MTLKNRYFQPRQRACCPAERGRKSPTMKTIVEQFSVSLRGSKKLFLISLFIAGSLILSWQMASAQTAPPKAKDPTPAVLICGTGVSPHYENIVNDLLDSLKEQSVSAKICEGHDFARSTAVEKAKEVGAGSVLY